MTKFNWQQSDWTNFQYDLSAVEKELYLIAEKSGFINGRLSHLTPEAQTEAMLDIMVEEAIKTSAIEGEHLRADDVRSSIRNNLGLNSKIVKVHDLRAQGIADLMLDVRKTFKKPLSETRLLNWHLKMLSGSSNPFIRVGAYRIAKEPMEIVSGYSGKLKVHFVAPPSKSVPKEMKRFIAWFNSNAPKEKNTIKFAPVRAAIAHLYFESIHPFDDGNGRIGRAIAEKALSQGYGFPVFFSLSHAIEASKKAYYSALEKASKSNQITQWIKYFINVILDAQINAEKEIDFIIKKAAFFSKYKDFLNDRQLKVIQRMLREGKSGFEGGMSAKKYMVIADTSKPTATRDLQALVAINALRSSGQGRNVRYELNL